jgi:anti-sigma factor RsiW
MRQSDCFFNDAELNAYLDSELARERQASLDTHLIRCPVCTRRFEVPRYLKIRIQDICRSTRAPERLRAAAIQAVEQSRDPLFTNLLEKIRIVLNGRPLVPVTLATAPVIVFCGMLFFKTISQPGNMLLTAMVHEHNEYIEKIDADNKIVSSDGEAIERWVQTNSGIAVKLPRNNGFVPCGACTTDEDGRNITCLFWGDGVSRISCFITPGSLSELGDPGPHKIKDIPVCCGKNTDINYVAWSQGEYLYIMISKLPEDALVNIAQNLI